MIRLILAALISAATAGQAVALSCLPASIPRAFQTADTAEAQYAVALGRVQLLPGEAVPAPSGDPNDRQGYAVRARFTGRLATAEGFVDAAAFPVTIEIGCAGAWCGGVPLNRFVAFIERRPDEAVIVEGPCPTLLLAATPENVAAAEACLRGEACAPAE